MEVIIRVTGIWASEPAMEVLFNMYKEEVLRTHKYMKIELPCKTPDSIILRNLQIKNGQSDYYAKANWYPATGYSIAMNIERCIVEPDFGIWAIYHELAHLYAVWKYNYWNHGDRFKEVHKIIETRLSSAP